METPKQKLINELESQLWRLKFDLKYNDSILPEVTKWKDDAQVKADAIKAELDEVSAGDKKKRETRDKIKKLAWDYGQAMKMVGAFASTIQGIEENKRQGEEKITGVERKVAFLETYDN